MTNDYDDIINQPHYEPKHHPRMSIWNRAAQFAPFAALTGYDAAIQESGRLTDDWLGLSESGNEEMNRGIDCFHVARASLCDHRVFRARQT